MAEQAKPDADGDVRDEEYTESAASSGPDDPEVREHQQDQAEQGAAQGGKGRIE